MNGGTPQGVIGGVVNGVIGGAQGIVHQVASALDGPLAELGAPSPAPHRAAVRVADGGFGAARSVVNGVIGALDVPSEAVGIPPSLGGGFGGLSTLGYGRMPFGRGFPF